MGNQAFGATDQKKRLIPAGIPKHPSQHCASGDMLWPRSEGLPSLGRALCGFQQGKFNARRRLNRVKKPPRGYQSGQKKLDRVKGGLKRPDAHLFFFHKSS